MHTTQKSTARTQTANCKTINILLSIFCCTLVTTNVERTVFYEGIGPEIVNEAVKVLNRAAQKHHFCVCYEEADLGGIAIDKTGVPLPQETVDKCKSADAVLLGAVGGPKWDNQPGSNRPEAGLLGIRGALGLFANLRPAVIFEPLRASSPLKEEIIGEAMDIMVVRELTGGIYFGERGR